MQCIRQETGKSLVDKSFKQNRYQNFSVLTFPIQSRKVKDYFSIVGFNFLNNFKYVEMKILYIMCVMIPQLIDTQYKF